MRKFSKSFQRFICMALTLCMLLSYVPGISVFAADEGSCIDFSFDASGATWGLDFGNELDAWERWQSFTMPETGTLQSAQVWLIKRDGTSDDSLEDVEADDLVASVYECLGGVPYTQVGESVTVAGSDVVNKGETTIDLSSIGELEAGKQYALVLATKTLTTSFDKNNGKYDWVRKADATFDGAAAGKKNGGGFAAESVGTMYLKVNYLAGEAQEPEVPDVPEVPSEPVTIDYSFDASGRSWGLDFGSTMDAWSRWQAFTMAETGTMQSADVWLIKRTAEDGTTRDLVAKVYETLGGVPYTQIGEDIVIAGEDVADKGVTTIDLSSVGVLEGGKQYALLLTCDPMADNLDKTNGCYDWPSNTATVVTEGDVAGKESGSGMVQEAAVGTMYLTVTYLPGVVEIPAEPIVIDYTFDASGKGWGCEFGNQNDAWSRWQSFTMPETGKLDNVQVWLFKKTDDEGNTNDLVAKIYTVENGLPATQVGQSVVVDDADVIHKGITTIDMSAVGTLEGGKQYALVLTTDPLLNAATADDPYMCYDWASDAATVVAEGDSAGKEIGSGFVDEFQYVGIMWLKVTATAGAEETPDPDPEPEPDPDPVLPPAPTDAVAYDITLSVSNKDTLEIGGTTTVTATVLDQNGAQLQDPEVSFSADSDVVTVTSDGAAATVTGAKEGVASIRVQSGAAVTYVDVYVYDQTKDYVIPTAGMVITEDTALKPGVYNFNKASTGITIGADNVTVTADYVKIINADESKLLSDTTTGAFAYELNPASGKYNYNMARELVLSDEADIRLSFDAKAKHFVGVLKVEATLDGINWTELAQVTPLGGWEKYTVDLSRYSGQTVTVRLRYEASSEIPEDMILKVDTLELFEGETRTFSDLCEAKPFYYWDMYYDNDARVPDSMKAKPFDRTASTINTGAYTGTGVVMNGVTGSKITGITVSGFFWAVKLTDCDSVTIEECTLTNNYTNPEGGWGDQDGGALLMENVRKSTIQGNTANNNANALLMRRSNSNTVKNNSFAICSDVCLEMDNSSYNTVENNDFSWGIRIDAYDEVHARDSTSSLFESGSSYNYIYGNDFTHGGDGIFLRPLDGFCCEGNIFQNNDASYANNNAVESWAGRNYYYNNKANWSSYGFWLGGSDESEMIGNEIAYNGICPHNAPETFGNAGISIVQSNPGSHIKIIGNDIHDNYGPGIALTHTEAWPAYHYLIQNNRIVNNKTSAYNAGHIGYAIWLDKIEWVDISGNLIEGNSNNSIRTSSYTKLVTERDGEYIADHDEYMAQAPVAAISSDKVNYYVGEEITFSGAGSTDPNGDALTFRWDLGDGTFAVGDTVKHTFTETGYYDVAFTVTDGTWSDIIWLNVNVVQPGEEIGTDEDVSKWLYTASSGATTLENAYPAEDKQLEGIPYYTYYTVDGDTSIKMHTSTGTNTITYPAAQNAGLDLSQDNALSFSMKVQNAAYEGTGNKAPIVRLYTDSGNYVQYQSNIAMLAPFYYKEYFAQMQLRHEWVAVTIPYEGSTIWSKSVVGNPDMSNINYISITTVNVANDFTIYVDGLKSVYVEETKANAYAQSMAVDGTAIYSTAADGSNVSAPISGTLDTTARWESVDGDESIWYGVDFGTERYIDRVDYYLYYEPVGNPSIDTVVLPNSATVEVDVNGEWVAVPEVEDSTIKSNLNTITFDLVKTSKVRVRFDTADNSPVALYGFHVFNTENYMTELDFEGEHVANVTSTVVSDITLDSVDIWATVSDVSKWDSDIKDLQVYIYETDNMGQGPAGAYIAKGLVSKADLDPASLPKIVNVKLYDAEGNQATLKAGKRYALLLAMERDYNNNGQAHWRFPTGNVSAAMSEKFGKVTGHNNNYNYISGYGVENLGTGWMKVYAAGSDKPVIDYSYDTTGKSGYGVGAYTEDSRYQTFTVPQATIDSVMNGRVNDAWYWSDENTVGAIYAAFEEISLINFINISFAEDGVPAQMVIKNGEDVVITLTADQLTAGFNEIRLDQVLEATDLTFEFTAGEAPVKVLEIETMSTLAAGNDLAVLNVIRMIDALGEITLDSEEAIEAARAAYDKLRDSQKELIENYDTLLAAEEKLAQLKKEVAEGHAAAAQASADEAKAAAEAARADAEAAKKAAEEAAAAAASDMTAAEDAAMVAAAAEEFAKAAEAAYQAAQAAADEAKAAAELADVDAAAAAAAATAEATEDAKAAAEDAAYARAAAEACAKAQKALAAAEEAAAAAEEEREAAEKAKEEAEKAAAEAQLVLAKYEALLKLADYADASQGDSALVDEMVKRYRQAIYNAESEEVIDMILAEAEEKLASLKPTEPDPEPADPCEQFTDVDRTRYYHEAVDYMIENGYMNGMTDTLFGVNENLTRGQLVTILYRIAGSPSVEGLSHGFTDVESDRFYSAAVLWAADKGIVKGMTETTFAPDAPVSRQQLVTFLYRFAAAEPVAENWLADFTDAGEVDGWAKDAMNWAVANGLVNGVTATTLQPDTTATRVQVCTILMRWLTK